MKSDVFVRLNLLNPDFIFLYGSKNNFVPKWINIFPKIPPRN